MPIRRTRTRTSPGPGAGGATSRISIFPGAIITACFTTISSILAAEPPAVDAVGRARAIARLRRAEKNEEVRDFFGRRESTHGGIVFRDLVEVLLPGRRRALGELFGGLHLVAREHETGVDAVDANVVRRELFGQALRKHHERRFRHVVDGLVAEGLLRADRSVVQDDTAAAPFHRAGETAAAVSSC